MANLAENLTAIGTWVRSVVRSIFFWRSYGLGRTRSEVTIAEMGIAGDYLPGDVRARCRVR